MGDSLSGLQIPTPDGSAAPSFAWPIAIYGIDTDGKPQLLSCTKPAFATSTLTGNVPANNETFTLNGKVYTFKTTLTPAEGEVLLGANETAALLNAKNAINADSGTNGTDYQVEKAHPTIKATASNATTVSLSARVAGTAGNLLTTTATGGVTVTGATLSGGLYAKLLTA